MRHGQDLEDQALFFFGSLMDPDVLEIVIGRSINPTQLMSGTLKDYRCEREIKESYPVLVPHPAGEANILIAHDLTQADIDRILFYETGEYDLIPFTVHDGTSQLQALGFTTGEGINTSGDTWSLNIWQKADKANFLPMAERFMQGYGKMTISEALIYWDELVEEFENAPTKEAKAVIPRVLNIDPSRHI